MEKVLIAYLFVMIDVITALESTADKLGQGTGAPPETIFLEDPRGSKLWTKLKASAGLPDGPYELLGRGTRGAAYALDEERVLKITNDRSEAMAAGLIRDEPDPRGNAQRIDQVWELRGESMTGWAIVQERLEQLDPEDPWLRYSDFWPDWCAANDFAAILPASLPDFFNDTENAKLVDPAEPSWLAFKDWLVSLAWYLGAIQLLYHDFWHRNLLRRGEQHVAIDFGYSRSKRTPDIRVLARYKNVRVARNHQ